MTESGEEHEYLTESGQLHQQPTEPRPRRPVAIVVLVATAFIVAVAIGVGTRTLIPSTSDRVTPSLGDPLSSGRTTASNSTSSDINVSRIADTVNPAVVNIDTTLSGGGRAAGTGMVITSSGEILTNNHVIVGATDITVDFGGTGRTRSARVVGYDVTHDIALLRIGNVSGLDTVTPGEQSNVSIDDPIVAIGNARGQGGTPAARAGSVTGLDQTITAGSDTSGSFETLHGLIQIDAAIEPGDSGGPLVDADGKVIGMNTAAAVNRNFQVGPSSVGFAIPIDDALAIAHDIAAGHSSDEVHIGPRAILGVQVRDTRSGVTVYRVEPRSPAGDARITEGDVIVSVGGRSVNTVDQLTTAMGAFRPAQQIRVTWVDDSGRHHRSQLALVEGPPA